MNQDPTPKIRCAWVPKDNQLYIHYHDEEWGVPTHDDRHIFEHLTLESSQAGLSWLTVLKKRPNYRLAFANFDPAQVAAFTAKEVDTLMNNSGIIRNRQKIIAAISNAQKFLEIQQQFGSFAAYQWQFVGGKTIQNSWSNIKQIPTITAQSTAFSQDLKRRGFGFVGPTTIYAHMQAVGLVNDHTTDCFRYQALRLNS